MEVTPDQAIAITGGFGKYQLRITVLFVLNYSLTGQFIYGLIFLEQPDNQWYRQLRLDQATKLQISFLNASFIIAQALSYLLVPSLVQLYGPRRVQLLITSQLAFVYLGLLFVQNIYLAMALLAWNGLLSYTLTFVYCASFLQEKHVALMGTLLMTVDGMTVGVQAVWYRCGFSFGLYFAIVVAVVVVVTIAMAFQLEQNWQWLGERGNVDKAYLVVSKIGQINGCPRSEFVIAYRVENNSLSEFVNENKRDFVCLLVYWSITSFNYFLLNFYLSQISPDIYRNAISSSLSESLGCILGGVLLTTKRGVKSASIIASMCPVIGSLGLVFCYLRQSQITYLFVILVNIGNGANFVLQSIMVVNLVKESDVQVYVYSACSFAAILVAALSPFCVQMLQAPIPMVVLFATSTVGVGVAVLIGN